MKRIFLFLIVTGSILIYSCHGKTSTNPLDSNTFDPNGVGAPLVVDTAIADMTDTIVSGSSSYDKADSKVNKKIAADTSVNYDQLDTSADKVDTTTIP